MKKITTLFCLLLLKQITVAQSWQDTVGRIEQIFERYRADQPGCQLAISKNGKIVYSKAYGMANLEYSVPLTTNSVIEAGSVSKQFTAAAILLLEQQGKLSLSDDVRKYIPELPDYGTTITLAHLIHHTSGLKDWGSLMALSDWPRGTKVYTNDEVLNIMSHQHSLNHQPGEEYLYSNSNYVLLAIIVKRVTGQSLADYTNEQIFKPAGMMHTSWRTNINDIVPGRAVAYSRNDSGYFTDMPYENVYGNGGLLTTAEDLLRWNAYYLSGKLGNPSILKKQLTTVSLNNGERINYAAGLRVDSLYGQLVVSHDGATAAYRSLLEIYTQSGISVAWLANTSQYDGDSDGTAELREILFHPHEVNNRAVDPKKVISPKTYTVDRAALKDYVGKFYSDEVESKLDITVINDQLTIIRRSREKFILVPSGKDAFNIKDSKVVVLFTRDSRNRISSFCFSTPKVRKVMFLKVR